jgi:AcrR family transcriptional regulator
MAQATAISGRTYRGEDAEERRARRRAQLLKAGLDLLGNGGWQATTVTAVCERAGLIPRYFYESFKDRQELLLSIFDGIIEEVTSEAFRLTEDHPPDISLTLRAAATAWVKVITADPRKGRVAFIEALGSEVLMRRRLAAARRYAELLEGTVRAGQTVPPERDKALEIACKIAVGGQVEALICWIDGSLHSNADELIGDYAKFCAAGIRTAIASPRKRTTKTGGS